MRVTTSMQADFWTSGIQNSLSNLNAVQVQIATGKSINQPSDNPAGAAQALMIGANLAANKQYQTDVTYAQSVVSATNSALTNASDSINAAIQIASQGANTTDASSYAALAQQVGTLQTQLIGVANTQVGDKYIFSGTATQTATYTLSGTPPTPTYQGNAGAISVSIGPNNTMQVNQVGSTVFGATFSALAQLKDELTNGVTAPASLPSANLTSAGGGGTIAAGTYSIGYTLVSPTGVELPLSGAGAVTVAAGGSSISLTTLPTIPAGYTANLYLSSDGGATYHETAVTGLTSVSATPATISAPPAGGAAAPPTQDTAISAISNLITSFHTALTGVSTVGANTGAQADLLQTTQQELTTEATQYQQSLSNIEDVDLASAAVQLQTDQNTYQATLEATSKAFQNNLTNYLQ